MPVQLRLKITGCAPTRPSSRRAVVIGAVLTATTLSAGAAVAAADSDVLAPSCGGLTQAGAVAAGYTVLYDAVGANDHVVGSGADDD